MFKGKRFTPAMIVAMIALAVALSGTAVAGTAKLITGSQIANGTIKLAHLNKTTKAALKGDRGATGAQGAAGAQGAQGLVGPQGATGAKGDAGLKGDKGLKGDTGDQGVKGETGDQGIQGVKGETGDQGIQGVKGETGAQGTKGDTGPKGDKGDKGDTGFSPTAFGPYASDSPDSSICGNDWATDTMDRGYVVYPQLDGSFLVTETFTNGTFTTLAGNSPEDAACGSTKDDVAAGVTGTMNGYFLVKIPAGVGNFDPEANCAGKCYTKDFVQAVFGTSSYDVAVYEMHYSSPGHGTWKNASANRGGNAGNIN